MNLIIHRGADQIGGTCIEVSSGGVRILFDLGLPLRDPSERTKKLESFSLKYKTVHQLIKMEILPDIAGAYEDADDGKAVDAVFISHPHQDHYGLCRYLRKDIPIYLGEDADKMLRVSDVFLPTIFGQHDTKVLLMHRKPVTDIPGFRITPFLMDHSGYGAMAFLIEADGKKIFYTGDFRGHGRKKALFEAFLRNPPQDVDVLLMEGTMMGRMDEVAVTEVDLETRIVNEARKYPGLKLISCSGQNVDRMITFYRAARRSVALFVHDLYTVNVLHELKRPSLPVPSASKFKDAKVLFTKHFMKKFKRQGREREQWYIRWRVFEIATARLFRQRPGAFVIFREKSIPELEEPSGGIPPGSCLFYSQWSQYMKEESFEATQAFCEKHHIEIIPMHTSGHASLSALQAMSGSINPRKHIIPVHTEYPDKYRQYFGSKVHCLKDGESISV